MLISVLCMQYILNTRSLQPTWILGCHERHFKELILWLINVLSLGVAINRQQIQLVLYNNIAILLFHCNVFTLRVSIYPKSFYAIYWRTSLQLLEPLKSVDPVPVDQRLSVKKEKKITANTCTGKKDIMD